MKSSTASALIALSATGLCSPADAASTDSSTGPRTAAQSAAQAATPAAPLTVTKVGSAPTTKGAPENFTGHVRVEMLHVPTAPWRSSSASVTFEPGARTVWHTHPVGQTLIVTAGAGQVQRWGGPLESIRAGDVVWIPAGVKHWHGATATAAMTHIAITESMEGKSVDWLEPVTDEQIGR